MGRDDKHAAPDVPEDGDEYDDGESHAADEPTAVWDESALRAAGLGDIFKKREAEASVPAPKPPVSPGDAPSMVVAMPEPDAPPDAPSVTPEPQPSASAAVVTPVPPAPAASKSLSWAATVGIAIALGAVAYALIRLLKG